MSVPAPGVKKTRKLNRTGSKAQETERRSKSATRGVKQGTSGTEVQSNKLNTNGRAPQRLDFDSLFCHHCDEGLAGHRYVMKEDNPYCIKCYESIFGNSCEECGQMICIDYKDLSYKGKHWHESCFLCTKCKTSMVDKQFGSKGDQVYCGPCYDTKFGSRCNKCGDVFKAGMKKMEYKGKQWHENCFICCVCKMNIGVKSFIPSGNDIYCNNCYESVYAAKCTKCSKAVTAGGVTYRDQPWHKQCFTCTHCNLSLAGISFTSCQDNPYCVDCVGVLFSNKCTTCTKPVTAVGGARFVSFEGRHWHNTCFNCSCCSITLVDRGFISDKEQILCPECAKKRMEADIVET